MIRRKCSKLLSTNSRQVHWVYQFTKKCPTAHKKYHQVSTTTTHLYNALRLWSRWVTKRQLKAVVTH